MPELGMCSRRAIWSVKLVGRRDRQCDAGDISGSSCRVNMWSRHEWVRGWVSGQNVGVAEGETDEKFGRRVA
jgi:hypothetical protein